MAHVVSQAEHQASLEKIRNGLATKVRILIWPMRVRAVKAAEGAYALDDPRLDNELALPLEGCSRPGGCTAFYARFWIDLARNSAFEFRLLFLHETANIILVLMVAALLAACGGDSIDSAPLATPHWNPLRHSDKRYFRPNVPFVMPRLPMTPYAALHYAASRSALPHASPTPMPAATSTTPSSIPVTMSSTDSRTLCSTISAKADRRRTRRHRRLSADSGRVKQAICRGSSPPTNCLYLSSFI